MRTQRLVSLALVTAALAFPGAALAQQAQAEASAGAATTGMGLPQAAATVGDSDHDMMVGTFAVGFLGVRTVPIGNYADATDTPALPATGEGFADAPVIGIRYWINPLLGIDAGLGIGFNFGKNKTEAPTGTTEDTIAGITRTLVHVGVPLALAGSRHYSFQVIPEANVGFATQQVNGNAALGIADRTNSGFLMQLGARAGAEVHFGFMGIPQLSLQASIGAAFGWESRRTKATLAGAETTTTHTRGSFSTAVYNNPWDILTSNVSAFYYF